MSWENYSFRGAQNHAFYEVDPDQNEISEAQMTQNEFVEILKERYVMSEGDMAKYGK